MIKKCVLLLVLLGLILGSAFTQTKWNFSMGAGGYFSNDFGGGFENTNSGEKMETPYAGGGFFAYFDATFAELSVGMLAAEGSTFDNGATVKTERALYGIDIGLFGKFPFHLGEMFTLYPLLGVDYRLMLTAKDGDYQYQNRKNKLAPIDLSSFWIKAGAGLDFSLNRTLYLRGEALYGIRFINTYEKDEIDYIGTGANSLLGHGFTLKLALGYRFN